MDLASVADELYGMPPGQFTSARDDRAAEARSSGDRELAKSIKELRRPTVSAWLANLLTRRRAKEIAQLLELGEAMRRAQTDLAAADIRTLSEKRRKLVAALGTQAKKLAGDLGEHVNDTAIQELAGTLEAALADSDAGESLQSGCLTTALHYSGFGPVDLTGAVAAPIGKKTSGPDRPDRKRPSPSKDASAPPAPGDDRSARAEHALRAAEVALVQAERSAKSRQDRADRIGRDRDRLLEQIGKLEQQLDALRVSAERAEREHLQAKKANKEAAAVLKKAEAAVVRARDAMDRLPT